MVGRAGEAEALAERSAAGVAQATGLELRRDLVRDHRETAGQHQRHERDAVGRPAADGRSASFILALSRALGETMAVTLAAGSNPILSLNPLKGIETMTAYMVSTSKGDIDVGTMKYWSIFAVGLVLFAFTFGMNMIARKLVSKFKLNYQ